MSTDDDITEEDFEEEIEDQCAVYCFGTEPNRTYSGIKMDKLDKLFDSDQDDGHIILRPNTVLHHRYQIKTMIGRGTFCLVWLAYDYLRCENVAIKVLKRLYDDNQDDSQFEDELLMNLYLSGLDDTSKQITHFYDVFYYEDHCCFVLELVSQNILTFINYFDDIYVPIPLKLIKKIVADTLKGLNFMHKNETIHTDLKPENVFAERPIFPYEPFSEDDTREVFNCLEDDESTINFKLGDFGNSCFADNILNDLIQTRQYRSPEVLLGLPYTSSADIWSLACMTFELATRHHLFDPVLSDSDKEETPKNRDLFDAVHLSMIESVLGQIPRDWARNGKLYPSLYNRHGELIATYHKQLPCLYNLLIKHGLNEQDAAELTEFLEPMLAIIPKQRPTAEQLLDSPWLYMV
ncbi:CMGC family protein kinase [Trichomonas vaginalis G3]|uniref:non-specific serine/threonine protein kinase n=1 Tax=Trichomonas vaginalis (strain ATCC PRA-98 / G3) TaxID=412133 RepID=A2FFH0_TRIV3|nr:spliceosomal complex assembly [Trichomonas vaginalis G3]EAX96340.1 CMGC family protein kinase [Trichomonas vaginalis G3]KAI5520126.1 spliceosomal complex assembly [Trichomonas vaginalis G3]|eukprot:XP_001309270.1 CMGC family protein kinase [Trichomonas vaginalis G3]